MHTKRGLFTLAGFLTTTLLSSTSAFAVQEPELYFYPSHQWKLNEPSFDTTSTEPPSCEVFNTYNNGFAVRFRGSENSINALDINFRQDIFEQGNSYPITLTVPGIKSEEFQARAVSAKSLRLDISNHDKFYQAAKTSSVFDLTLEQNYFRFYMLGFAQQADAFEQCVARATNRKTVVTSSAELAPPVAPPKAAFVNEAAMMETKESGSVPITEVLPEKLEAELSVQDKSPAPILKTTATTEEPERIISTTAKNAHNKRPRFTEQLAAQIAENPDLIDLKEPDLKKIKGRAAPPPLGFAPDPAPASTKKTKPLDTDVDTKVLPIPTKDDMSALDKTPEPIIPTPEAPQAEIKKDTIASIPAEAIQPMIKLEKTPPVQMDVKPINAETPIAEPEMSEENIAFITPVKPEIAENDIPVYDFTAIEPSAGMPDDTTAASASEISDRAEMSRHISELNKMVSNLRAEKAALDAELKASRSQDRNEQMSISSENWNLERTTRLYNEAERQLKKIGRQLQQERAQCSVEKKELEMMLFDPQLTNQAQMAKLSELRRELEEARAEISALRASQ